LIKVERNDLLPGSADLPQDQGLSRIDQAGTVKADLRFVSHYGVRHGKYCAFPAP
jgi:hypothetical protein